MKPKEKKPETIFRLIDKKSGEAVGSYSRACCDEFDFNSPEEARNANVHGMFKNENKYKVAKYRVTYELIEDDVLQSKLEIDDNYEKFEAHSKQVWINFKNPSSSGKWVIANCYTEKIATEIANALNETKKSLHSSH